MEEVGLRGRRRVLIRKGGTRDRAGVSRGMEREGKASPGPNVGVLSL